ncbi:MAG: alcohol dehydrogenase catalytic domain-containing protein [Candidatus Aminicenantia bacterium]
MKIALYYSNSDIRISEIPYPEISEREVAVEIQACGICGSDLMEWYRKDKVPLVLGHEIAGEIDRVGKEVKNFSEGERVVIAHHVPCGSCHYCIMGNETVCETLRKTNIYPGGFSQFAKIPEINVEKGLFKIPEELSFEEATFAEPLGCVLRAQRKIGIKHANSVVVIGSGISGLLHIQLAKLSGAGPIIASDTVEWRMEKALRFGADFAFYPSELEKNLKKILSGELADILIVCAGSRSAIELSFKLINRAGKILFYAPSEPGFEIKIPFNEIFWKNDTLLTTSYAASPSDYAIALSLIHQKRVDVKNMITHVLSLDEIKKGFEIMAKSQDSLKVIVKPNI